MGRDQGEVLGLMDSWCVEIDMRGRWQYKYSYQLRQLSGNFVDGCHQDLLFQGNLYGKMERRNGAYLYATPCPLLQSVIQSY